MTMYARRISTAVASASALLLGPLAGSSATLVAQSATPAPVALSLGDAARLAARQSAPAQAARYRAEQAGARARERRADLLPRLYADATQGENEINTATFGFSLPGLDPNGQIIGPVRTTDLRGHASQTLLDFGALERYRGAQASADAGVADAASSADQAAAAAALAYLRVLRAEAQTGARLADSAIAGDLLGIARDQLAAGVGIALDVTRAQSQLASVRAQLIAARGARDRARLDLLRALNLPLDTPLSLTDSLAALPEADTVPDESAAIARALGDRPDLRAADRQFAAAERGVTAIRAERLPSLAIFGNQGAIGISDHLLNTYTWGLQLSVPLFDGFRREARIEEQRAAVHEVEVRRGDLRQAAAVEVRGALLDLNSTREQVAAARERQQFAEQEVAQARERFRTGVAGNADVVTALLGLNNARTSLIDALTSYQAARVGLAYAQGIVTTLR